MVNKSMMHTHASGCHKRRSLPAHSLVAVGISLLLTFSFPLIVRADANFLTEEAINKFYTIDKLSQYDNRDTIETSYSLNNDINNNLLSNSYNIDDQIINEYEPSADSSTLIVKNDYQILDEYTDLINYIITNGTLEVSSELTNIKSLVMYGGTVVTDKGKLIGEGSEAIIIPNISFENNSNIIVDATNNKYDSSLGHVVIYNGYLDAKNSNLTFKLNNIYDDRISHGTLLYISGGCDISGSTLNISVSGDVDISKGYTLSLMEIVGENIITDNIKTLNSSIKIGSTIISGNGFAKALWETRKENIEGWQDPNNPPTEVEKPETEKVNIYLDLLPSENGTIDGAKGISEGYLSGLMLTLQGADLVATRGMQAAMAATKEVEDVTFTPWATVSGSSVRYNTGAHADLNSFNMLTGIALGKGFDAGRVTVGAFFEYGTGSYKTSNSFDGHGSYDGKGDSYYLGWGLLARMDFADTGPGHFYVEGSGRMGGLYNNYSNGDLRDGFGREAEYDSYAPYYSFHAGLGYIWDINEQTSLEFYGKYLWTRECGDSVTLSTGEEVDFEDIDSSRLRFGTRLDYRVNEYITPYIGVAWEHEFDGESSATTNNLPILEPDLRGDTGIGEIGLTITPSETIPLTVDLGVTGYVGTREGISGSLLVKWTF